MTNVWFLFKSEQTRFWMRLNRIYTVLTKCICVFRQGIHGSKFPLAKWLSQMWKKSMVEYFPLHIVMKHLWMLSHWKFCVRTLHYVAYWKPLLEEMSIGFVQHSYIQWVNPVFLCIWFCFPACSELVEKYYGNNWFYDSPEERKLLDFTPDNDTDQLLVLWNRTNPQSNKGVRGRMSYSDTWQMACVTQSDNGHYYFRKQDGTVLKTVQLLVKGAVKNLIEVACNLLDCCAFDSVF